MKSKVVSEFLKYAIIISIISVILLIGIFFLFNGEADFRRFEPLSTLFQGTIGLAVAFAGAWVAIKIASIATLTIQKEKDREDFMAVNQLIKEGLSPYFKLGDKLSDLYLQYIIEKPTIDSYVKEIGKDPDWRDKLHEKLHPKADYKIAFGKIGLEIVDCLDNSSSNIISNAIWRAYVNIKRTQLHKLYIEGILINNKSIIEIKQLLKLKSLQLIQEGENPDNSNIILPKLKSSLVNKNFYLFDIGDEFFGSMESKNKYFGTAFFINLIESLPTDAVIFESVIKEIVDETIPITSIKKNPYIRILKKSVDNIFISDSLRSEINSIIESKIDKHISETE